MAIFKIMKAKDSFYAIRYNESKIEEGDAQRIHLENFGTLAESNFTQLDLRKYLERWTSANKRIKLPQFHATISAKGKDVSFDELKNQAMAIMKKLGYENNPIVMYEHKDTKNNHVHIVTTRVGQTGKKINDFNEQYRAHKYMTQINERSTGESFSKRVGKYQKYKFSTASQFNLLFENAGYSVSKNDVNFIYAFNGKEVGQLTEDFIFSKTQHVKNTEEINRLKAIISKYKGKSSSQIKIEKGILQSDLTKTLKEKIGLQFIFFSKEGNQSPYGYVIIDHKMKTIHKGSDIMKLNTLLSENQVRGVSKAKSKNKDIENPRQKIKNYSVSENNDSNSTIKNDKNYKPVKSTVNSESLQNGSGQAKDLISELINAIPDGNSKEESVYISNPEHPNKRKKKKKRKTGY